MNLYRHFFQSSEGLILRAGAHGCRGIGSCGIVHEECRQAAIHSMLRALEECTIEGVSTTIPFHKQLLEDPGFRHGRVHTKYVEEEFLKRNGC